MSLLGFGIIGLTFGALAHAVGIDIADWQYWKFFSGFMLGAIIIKEAR